MRSRNTNACCSVRTNTLKNTVRIENEHKGTQEESVSLYSAKWGVITRAEKYERGRGGQEEEGGNRANGDECLYLRDISLSKASTIRNMRLHTKPPRSLYPGAKDVTPAKSASPTA